jgi:site-specific DNA recombinase
VIAKAHLYLEALTDGSGAGHTEVADRLGIHDPDISRILPIAFLAPKITEAILTGRQPADLTIAKLTRMLDLPTSWKDQAALLAV